MKDMKKSFVGFFTIFISFTNLHECFLPLLRRDLGRFRDVSFRECLPAEELRIN